MRALHGWGDFRTFSVLRASYQAELRFLAMFGNQRLQNPWPGAAPLS